MRVRDGREGEGVGEGEGEDEGEGEGEGEGARCCASWARVREVHWTRQSSVSFEHGMTSGSAWRRRGAPEKLCTMPPSTSSSSTASSAGWSSAGRSGSRRSCSAAAVVTLTSVSSGDAWRVRAAGTSYGWLECRCDIGSPLRWKSSRWSAV